MKDELRRHDLDWLFSGYIRLIDGFPFTVFLYLQDLCTEELHYDHFMSQRVNWQIVENNITILFDI